MPRVNIKAAQIVAGLRGSRAGGRACRRARSSWPCRRWARSPGEGSRLPSAGPHDGPTLTCRLRTYRRYQATVRIIRARNRTVRPPCSERVRCASTALAGSGQAPARIAATAEQRDGADALHRYRRRSCRQRSTTNRCSRLDSRQTRRGIHAAPSTVPQPLCAACRAAPPGGDCQLARCAGGSITSTAQLVAAEEAHRVEPPRIDHRSSAGRGRQLRGASRPRSISGSHSDMRAHAECRAFPSRMSMRSIA
jgi:hypothetical protein